MNSQKGYSLIEIGIGLLIIAIFSFFSIALFNGCYNNHRVIAQRNIAIAHAINTMENALQSDLDSLGFTEEMIDRDQILLASNSASKEELEEGKYAVPEDYVYGPNDITNNMKITTKCRRISGADDYVADSTVLKIIVDVEYKIRVNDSEARHVTLESVKVTK